MLNEYNIVNHDVCGKVVVATDESEFKFMDQIFENGIANSTEGIEKINQNQIKEIEPSVAWNCRHLGSMYWHY